ncbi:hypothetical protein [Candidatus Avelusimicrobium stercoris]
MRKRRICPKCGGPMGGYPAISPKGYKTAICSNCGLKEALEAYNRNRSK